MRLNKFLSLCASAVICVALAGCYKTGSEAFERKVYIGSYKGMKVELIRDETASAAKGFYLIDYASYDPGASSSEELSDSKVIGEYGNFNVIFVKDEKVGSPAKGFYLFEDKNTGMLAPGLNYTVTHGSGKNTTQYSMTTFNSSIFTSPSQQDKTNSNYSTLSNQTAAVNLQVKQLDNQDVQLERMSEQQLLELASKAIEVAKSKRQNEQKVNPAQNISDLIPSSSKASLIPR